MQPTLASRASVILGPDLGPKVDPRVEKQNKTNLTAAKTQMLILLLHNVGDLSCPGKLESEGFQARANNIHPQYSALQP